MAGARDAPTSGDAKTSVRFAGASLRRAGASIVAGTALGVGLIHTTAALVMAWGDGRPAVEVLGEAFAPPGWLFVVYHAVVGAVFGAGMGLVLDAMYRRDLAQRERARELERLLDKAQRVETLGRLAGGVAHDFNNLLTAIRTNLYLALRQLGPDQPAQRHVADAAQVAERAGHLPRQLLAFARRQPGDPRQVRPAAVVGDLRRMLERLLGDHIALHATLEGGAARIDPGQLEQVVMNLAVNARDAMPGGGELRIATADEALAPEAAARLGLPPGTYVTIAVRDTGTGMPPEVLDRLFEPFFTTKPEGQGTGLGLATSFGIVRQRGGTIAAQSAVGQGSTFTVYLPWAAAEAAPAEAALPAAAAPARAAAAGVVLVVDDQAAVRTVLADLLRACGYHALAAGDGEEALRVAGAAGVEVDVLLADVVMPRMGGLELAARFQVASPRTRVLLMTGNPEALPPAAERAEVLAKPFPPEDLLRRLDALLRAHGTPPGPAARAPTSPTPGPARTAPPR